VQNDPRELTFIVRLRRQSGAAGPQWRGSVREVSSGGRRFITGTREIGEFIAAFLGGDERPRPP
jgi:hypothetical protein